MKHTITLLISILFFQFGISQEYEVINHSYENFHDFPQNIFFAEDVEGSIWVLQRGGFTGDVISKYSNGEWESIEFNECSNCTYRITSNNEGIIYLATNRALYAYENNTWVEKFGDFFTSRDIDIDSNDRLWFTHNGSVANLAYITHEGELTKLEEIEGSS